jgi:hypothetical protein
MKTGMTSRNVKLLERGLSQAAAATTVNCAYDVRTSLPRRIRCGLGQPAIRSGSRAFSLIEIIIVVSLLTVIMLGLMLMFNQTQRVFQTGVTQVDVLEAGRAATGLIARQMEQITPAGGVTTNFFAGVLGGTQLMQPMPGGGSRGNVLQDVFFVTRENQTWTGTGYFVRAKDAAGKLQKPDDGGGIRLTGGQLYRFEETVSAAMGPEVLFGDFYKLTSLGSLAPTNVTPVMDGVIHFKVRAYDTNGFWIQNYNNFSQGFIPSNSVYASTVGGSGEVSTYRFREDAVPAAVEFELALIENRVWEKYKALPAGNARYNYLTNQVGRVQVFRQLVPVRNVDPTAYQ